MARTKVDIITCDRCGRTLEEADVKMIEFSILYHDPREIKKGEGHPGEIIHSTPGTPSIPAPAPTRYVEVCKRCDTLLRKLASQAAPPSKPGRKKEKEDE